MKGLKTIVCIIISLALAVDTYAGHSKSKADHGAYTSSYDGKYHECKYRKCKCKHNRCECCRGKRGGKGPRGRRGPRGKQGPAGGSKNLILDAACPRLQVISGRIDLTNPGVQTGPGWSALIGATTNSGTITFSSPCLQNSAFPITLTSELQDEIYIASRQNGTVTFAANTSRPIAEVNFIVNNCPCSVNRHCNRLNSTLTCCAGSCANTEFDTFNCGSCGSACFAPTPFCSSAICQSYIQQTAKLVGSGFIDTDVFQGMSVALSSDGNTLAVGGFGDNDLIGATWIFTRSDSTWTQQGPKLVASDAIGESTQGFSVALSDDGNTVAIGGPTDNLSIGAGWVFTRLGTLWTQQAKLVGTGHTMISQQGIAIALSADGNTLALGGHFNDNNVGGTWIFVRSGTTWTQQAGPLVGSDAVGNANQGISVALSADGNTLAIGGFGDNGEVGATWVFTRTGTTWTQQGPKLVGTPAIGSSEQGRSVDLSDDGNTLAIGGPHDDNDTGATWIFTRSGGIWSQQAKLVGTGGINGATQGFSVSLSADGNTLAIGGDADDNFAGATWIFTRSGTTWTQSGPKLVGTGAGDSSRQGSSVSLSDDSNILAVGASGDQNNLGATWVFVR